ncbi:hypothetical protein [Alteribacillus sp. YIM 98480]|uniref:hypothetical protein n=1 Tax=Alteribacillus sp. YIM 98480 TaxID=2606599 RepID=UPI00131D52D0|nr:hypothetical protein [Alteribacillus sp. YIM 98480]
MITKKDVFYCYDAKLAKFLKDKGVYSLTTAINPASKNMFTMFVSTDEMQEYIKEFKEMRTAEEVEDEENK